MTDQIRTSKRCVGMNAEKRRRRRAALLERDGNKCWWCKKKFTLELPPTFDHIIPRKKGGMDTIDNLVLACAPCNNGRANPPKRKRLHNG